MMLRISLQYSGSDAGSASLWGWRSGRGEGVRVEPGFEGAVEKRVLVSKPWECGYGGLGTRKKEENSAVESRGKGRKAGIERKGETDCLPYIWHERISQRHRKHYQNGTRAPDPCNLPILPLLIPSYRDRAGGESRKPVFIRFPLVLWEKDRVPIVASVEDKG
jgi:hypothetical protein